MAAASSSSVRALGVVYRHEELAGGGESLLGRLTRRRGGAAGGKPSRSAVAKSMRTIFEALETRQMLSVLPAPQVTDWQSLSGTSTTANPTYNTTPSIAYDPANPQNLVMVYQSNLTNANSRPDNDQLVYIEGRYSRNGGQTWVEFGVPLNMADYDASVAANGTVLYAQATHPTVSFDRDGNFYVAYAQHRADYSHGVVVLQSYQFDPVNGPTLIPGRFATLGGTPGGTTLGFGSVVHQWFAGVNEARWPTVTANSNLDAADIAALPGPLPAEIVSQADPTSGRVYVAWVAEWSNTSPQPIPNFNPSSVMLTVSQDGGESFATPTFVSAENDPDDPGSNRGYVGQDRNITPKVVVAQGTVDGTTVVPGTVSVVWVDVNSARNRATPVDIIRTNQISGGLNSAMVWDPTETDITDASTTLVPLVVAPGTLTGTRLTDFDVNLAITHATVGQLSLVLVPPTAALNKILNVDATWAGWDLLLNRLQDPSVTFPGQGITATDLGYNKAGGGKARVGTTFDDDAPRLITDAGAAPYLSAFSPEAGRYTFDAILAMWTAAGLTMADFEGTWTLMVTDHVANAGVTDQYVDGLAITFTTDSVSSGPGVVAETTVLGSQTGVNPLQPGVASGLGIGPGISVAIDNTLGAFSPNQGRIYVAYVNRSTAAGNPTDNTDIQMVSKAAGGGWTPNPVLVNDDNAMTDGYSEAVRGANITSRGRAQFQPSVTVDQYTGTVVVTYSDARQDAARVRFATSLQTSIDGGQTFSKSAFLNQPNVVVDASTGESITVGPRPDNGTFNDDPTYGMGYRQDVVAVGGRVYAVWTGNLNGGTPDVNRLPDILTANVKIGAGPRVESSTMGVVGEPGDWLNPPLPDGTPVLRSFVLNFDRPVDLSTIITAGVGQNIFLYYREPGKSGNVAGTLVPLSATVTPFDAANGVDLATVAGMSVRSVRIQLADPTQDGTKVGTYSYYVEPTIADRIRKATTLTNTDYLRREYGSDAANSNLVIPATGTGGPGADTVSTITVAGMPTASKVETITGIAVKVNLLHTFDSDVSLFLEAPDGVRYPLVLFPPNNGRNMINTIFDSDSTGDITTAQAPYTGTFAPAASLAALIADLNDPSGTARNGAWKLVVEDSFASDAGKLRNWTITFRTSVTSGQLGNHMDQNADATPGTAAWSATTVGDVYANPNPVSDQAWDEQTKTFHTPYNNTNSMPIIVSGAAVTDTRTYGSQGGQNGVTIVDPANPASVASQQSTIAIAGDAAARITDLKVRVNLVHGSADTLRVELVAPDGTAILLRRPDTIGTRVPIANMIEMIFDDSAARAAGSVTSPATQNASLTPFSGRFRPENAAVDGQGLSRLKGKALNGVWTLRVTDTESDSFAGVIADWSITATTEAVTVNPAQADPSATPSVNSVVVTFDRPIDPALLLPGAIPGLVSPVQRIVGPLGEIAVSPTYTATGANLGVAVPDLQTKTSKIKVNDTFRVGHVAVRLNVSHLNTSDLAITLIAPDGTPVSLVANRGATGDHFVGTLISDLAPAAISAGAAPFNSSLGYRPESPLSALAGKSVKGDWTLQVSDSNGNAVTGVINSWSLTLTPQIVAVTAGDPAFDPAYTATNRTFRIYIPDQRQSGSYSLTLSPELRETASGFSFKLDSNKNAGLEAMRDAVTAANAGATIPTVPFTYTQSAATPIAAKDAAVPGSEVTRSVITVTDSFDIRKLTLRLNMTFASASNLAVTLTAPDGVTTVKLFTKFGNFGAQANFSNTVFDDAATTPVQHGAAPYVGAFIPHEALSAFNGINTKGDWTLTITNSSTGVSGQLNGWSMTASKTVTNTGLGEAGSDQATVNFRIFNMAAGNASASTGWTPVSSGGTSVTSIGSVQNGVYSTPTTLSAGSITDVVVDPSDPSGNTVYVSTASGGVWKTTNFLTTNPNGPTYVPLTDFGPVNGLNIGSIAVFAPTSPTPQNVKLNGTLYATPGAYFPGFEANKAFDGSFQTFFWGPNADYDYVGYQFAAPTLVTQVKFAPANSYGHLMVGGKFQGSTDGTTWTELHTITSAPLDGVMTTVTVGNPGNYTYVRYLGPAGITARAMISELEFYGPAASTVTAGGSNRSVVVAGTGQGAAGYTDAYDPSNGNQNRQILRSPGVGILLSTDGGSTWNLLDSLTNVDASGNWLPIGSPLRDHRFVGTATFKVVVDPRPTPAGETIIYAALTGPNGGLYRSVDTGKHWTLLRAGDATDVILDHNSGTVNAQSNPTGNVQIVYAGFRGEGVFMSPNRGGTWTQLLGDTGGTPLVRDGSVATSPPAIPTLNQADPNGNKGRIVLAMPSPSGDATADVIRQGWIYAAVVNAHATNRFGTLDGLYVTKDGGLNWTEIPLHRIDGTTFAPTNDSGTSQTFDVVNGGPKPGGEGNYSLSLTVDPNNPAVLYVAGSGTASNWGIVRVDTTRIFDAHAFYTPQDAADGGQLTRNITAAVSTKDLTNLQGSNPFGSANLGDVVGNGLAGVASPQYVNLVSDPRNPFVNNGTFYVWNTVGWQNTGRNAFWRPVDGLFNTPFFKPDSQRVIATVDPVTGGTRLILATDSGVFTAVTNADGSLNAAVGNTLLANGSRNGNLQNAQVLQGAAQPGSLAAQLAGAMFYAMTETNGVVVSDPNVLSNGNLVGNVNLDTETGGNVAVDQTGTGNVYANFTPGAVGTDFFKFFPPGTMKNNVGGLFVYTVGGIGRTTGLITSTSAGGSFHVTQDFQWPDRQSFPFAVNPVNGGQVVMGSWTGTVYATYNQGQFWSRIAAASDLDGTIPSAFAYGAPGTGSDSLSNLIFVGTSGVVGLTGNNTVPAGTRGQVFVSFSGGGSWTNLDSAGLDGSAIKSIVTNPARGSHEVYVVTEQGVYHMADATAAGATWTEVTGNLFDVAHAYLGNGALYTEDRTQTLTSIVADWRYQLPNVSGVGTHPVLYASGNAGVYRSTDNGVTWKPFPAAAEGAQVDGGYLPNVKVTDLDLSLGVINPTTGMPLVNGTSQSVLLASTYGRGQFAIRVAPLAFNAAFGQDTALGQRTVTGLSQINAYGNQMTFKVWDVTNPDAPVELIQPVAAEVNNDGTFKVTLPAAFAGTKVAVQAVDGAGVAGPLSTLLVPPPTPSAPDLVAGSDSGASNTDNLTNDTTPTVSGTVVPGNNVSIYRNGTFVTTFASNASTGEWSYTFGALAQGVHNITVSQTDAQNQTSAQSVALAVTIDTAAPVVTPKALSAVTKGSTTNFNLATVVDLSQVVSVTINWGDGTAAEVVNNPSPANGATWDVFRSHTYANAGTRTVTITALDNAGNVSAAATTSVQVTPPAHEFDVTPWIAASNPQEGSVFNGRVAIVKDTLPGRTASDITATINWGDGSAPTVATLNPLGGGQWEVLGTHTYIDNRQDGPSAFTIFVSVTTVDGDAETVGTVGNVSNLQPNGTVSDPGAVYVGSSVSLALTATDPSPADVAAGFEYRINWGDGTAIQTIARTPGNGSGVNVAHTFAAASNGITVTIVDKDGAERVISKPITVSALPVMKGSAVNGSAARSDISQITFNVANTGIVGGLSLANLNLYYNGDGVNPLSLAGAALTFDPSSGNGTLDLRNLVTPLQDGDYQLHINVAGKRFFISFFKLAGDLNGSGAVDDKDLTILNKAKGKSAGQPGFNFFADLNKDGTVNNADVTLFNRLKNRKATGGTLNINLKTGNAGVIPTIDFGSVKRKTNGGYVDLVIKNTNTNGVMLNIGKMSVTNKKFAFAIPNQAWGPDAANTITRIEPGKSLTVRVYLKPVAKAGAINAAMKFSFATISQKDYKDVSVPVKAMITA